MDQSPIAEPDGGEEIGGAGDEELAQRLSRH
jgi:hypothetical protein